MNLPFIYILPSKAHRKYLKAKCQYRYRLTLFELRWDCIIKIGNIGEGLQYMSVIVYFTY